MPPIRTDKSSFAGTIVRDPGPYEATIYDWKREAPSNGAKTKGADCWRVQFKLDGGALFERYYNHPTTLWRFKQLAVAAGINPAEFRDDRTVGFTEDFDAMSPDEIVDPLYIDELMSEIVGNGVVLDLIIETGTGGYADKNGVKSVKALGAALTSAGGGNLWPSAA